MRHKYNVVKPAGEEKSLFVLYLAFDEEMSLSTLNCDASISPAMLIGPVVL